MKLIAILLYLLFAIIMRYSPATAITFSNVTSPSNLDNYQLARCSAWIDYDRDGNQDLIVGSEYGYNRLHRNNGDGTFANVTEEMGIVQRSGIWGVNVADINNDGFQELYFCARAPDTVTAGRNILLLNNGGTCFYDISELSGTNVPGGGVAACFAPFDKDAYIDLFVPNQYYPNMEYPYLMLNMMNNTFIDNTYRFGLNMPDWWNVPVVFDYDNDRGLDLFCTKDYNGNSLYKEIEHSHFQNITDSANIQTPCGYGVTVGDVNNDGWFDLYITNWHNLTDNLFIYDTTERYINKTNEWNVPGNIWTSSPQFADFDNDGWLDLAVMAAGTGNRYYRNLNGTGFEDNTLGSGFTNNNYNWGASVCDYNNDGFLDIYMPEYIHGANGGRLYRNNGNGNNWVKIELVGISCNRDAIGTRLWLYSQTTAQTRQVMAGTGFGSQNSLIQHFGLAQDSVINLLEIWWPDGETDIFEAVPANQSLRIIEGEALQIRDYDINIFPNSYQVRKIYPNPFNSSIGIELEVYIPGYLKIEIIDILGRRISFPFEGDVSTGIVKCFWNGLDLNGQSMATGIYLIKIMGDGEEDLEKIILLR